MTVQTLYTAATGMEAMETKLDVIANNMANINTTGFKKDRANFEDVFYRQYRLPGALDADGNRTATGVEVGLGTRVSSTQSNFKQGSFQTTNDPLDFAIEGDGYFQVQTRKGSSCSDQRTRATCSNRRLQCRRRRRVSSSLPTDRCNTARRRPRVCKP